MAGRPSETHAHSSQSNLTITEEDAIIQYISQLDSRGLSPQKADVEDMANLLLLKRDERRVGEYWTDRFIARQPKLRPRFAHPYDYQSLTRGSRRVECMVSSGCQHVREIWYPGL